MNTGIILLAAGSSSRMGESKQLLQVAGVSLLERTISQAKEISNHVIVVLGSQYELHNRAVSHLSVKIVENKSWKKGMGNSLKAAMAQPTIDELDALIVLVCDQPLLSADHLKKLIEASKFENMPIAASKYNQIMGVPALFLKPYFSSLKLLGDQEGARKIILAHIEQVTTVDFPGGEIDLDTMADYDKFVRRK